MMPVRILDWALNSLLLISFAFVMAMVLFA